MACCSLMNQQTNKKGQRPIKTSSYDIFKTKPATKYSMEKIDGKSFTEKRLFSRSTEITKLIKSDVPSIWDILMETSSYTSWNSTIILFEGAIKKGTIVRLKRHLDKKRVFKLKVKEVVPYKKFVWGDAMGNRTFLLTPTDHGTSFNMKETIGGPFYPLFSRFIPDFDSSFERFANDLEKAVTKN